MTPEQLESVRRTAALVEQAYDQCASCFYDDLFERHPPARRLFADDLIARRGTLVDELLSLVAAADDLHGFLAQARVLGLRHQRQGIHAADYAFVGEALIAAIAAVVGEGWTDEAEAAWRRMYALIAEAMLEGAEEGLFIALRLSSRRGDRLVESGEQARRAVAGGVRARIIAGRRRRVREVERRLGGEQRRADLLERGDGRPQPDGVDGDDAGRVVGAGGGERTLDGRRQLDEPVDHRRGAAEPDDVVPQHRLERMRAPLRGEPARRAGAPRARRRRPIAPSPTNPAPGHDRCGTGRRSPPRARARRLDRDRGTRRRRRR